MYHLGKTEYLYEGQLRLVMNGSSLRTRAISFSGGRLQVYLNNEWTFVCNETFGDTEAESACRQLGYTTALYYAAVDNQNRYIIQNNT